MLACAIPLASFGVSHIAAAAGCCLVGRRDRLQSESQQSTGYQPYPARTWVNTQDSAHRVDSAVFWVHSPIRRRKMRGLLASFDLLKTQLTQDSMVVDRAQGNLHHPRPRKSVRQLTPPDKSSQSEKMSRRSSTKTQKDMPRQLLGRQLSRLPQCSQWSSV